VWELYLQSALSFVIPSGGMGMKMFRFSSLSPRTTALSFVIPSEAEGSAVLFLNLGGQRE
jgi:hypothetical protein